MATVQNGEQGEVKNKTEARQGVTLNAMRYVLGISIALVIVGFLAAYLLAV